MCSYLTGSLSLIHFSLFKLSTIKWTWNVCDIPTLTNRVTTERYYFFHVYLHFCTVGNSRTQIVQIIESVVASVRFFNLRDFRLQIVDAFCLGCLAAVNTEHTTWRDVRLLSLVFHRMFLHTTRVFHMGAAFLIHHCVITRLQQLISHTKFRTNSSLRRRRRLATQ